MKRTTIFILVLMLSLGVVFAAGGAEKTPKTPVSSTGAPVYKEHVKIAIEQAITTGDPHALSNIPHNILFKLSHNTLVNLDSATMNITPELAESWEWTAPNVLVLKLRKGVKFQNGVPLTAEDVAFTFERAKKSNTVSSKMVSLDKCTALDELTVEMTLFSPNVDWLDTLSLPMCSILSKSNCEADPIEGSWIGTGAWVIKDLNPSDYVALDRNEGYWDTLPETKKMTIRYIPEDSSRLIALQKGELDVCVRPSDTELNFITEDPNLQLIQYNSTTCTYFAFNTSKAPGNNQNLRLALAHCLDIDDIIIAAKNGLASPAISNWGWSTYGYWDGFGAYGKDLDKAKAYLAKAFPKGNAKLTISTAGSERMATAQVIQEQARQIGLEIQINELEAAALTSLTAFKTAGHESMLYSLGWNSCGDDARRAYYQNSNTNKATLTDPRIMELIDLAVAEFDDATRKSLYKEVQVINHEQAYYIPLYYAIQNVGINKNLTGVIWESHQSHDFTYAKVQL
jgi:peptide/nickel transport system substrate-binding protein